MSSPFEDTRFAGLSPESKSLHGKDLSSRVLCVTMTDRIRMRLRAEMKKRHLSQRGILEKLNKYRQPTDEPWSQSRLSKMLKGRTVLRVADVDAVAGILGISWVELIRDHGHEFMAEMQPSELLLLELVRARGPEALRSLLTLLHNNNLVDSFRPRRRAASPSVAHHSRRTT
jgi:transcriptional regulator with XRE-family HTH domain